MQDGRCRLINRGNLLLRLIEWQAHRSEKMKRQIVGGGNESGKERGKKRGGGGVVIIGALDVMSLCYMGLEVLMRNVVSFPQNQTRAAVSRTVTLLYSMFFENLMSATFSLNWHETQMVIC